MQAEKIAALQDKQWGPSVLSVAVGLCRQRYCLPDRIDAITRRLVQPAPQAFG